MAQMIAKKKKKKKNKNENLQVLDKCNESSEKFIIYALVDVNPFYSKADLPGEHKSNRCNLDDEEINVNATKSGTK